MNPTEFDNPTIAEFEVVIEELQRGLRRLREENARLAKLIATERDNHDFDAEEEHERCVEQWEKDRDFAEAADSEVPDPPPKFTGCWCNWCKAARDLLSSNQQAPAGAAKPR